MPNPNTVAFTERTERTNVKNESRFLNLRSLLRTAHLYPKRGWQALLTAVASAGGTRRTGSAALRTQPSRSAAAPRVRRTSERRPGGPGGSGARPALTAGWGRRGRPPCRAVDLHPGHPQPRPFSEVCLYRRARSSCHDWGRGGGAVCRTVYQG